jgi:Z1 domain
VNDQHEKARSIVLRLLPSDGATRELIEQKVALVLDMLRVEAPDAPVDGDLLTRELESLCNVWMPTSTWLDDAEGHQAWLNARRGDIDWRFWRRYERYLEEQAGLPPAAVKRLDEITDQIISRFEDPARPAAWDRRGLVVGQVQSGKTANYTGVICKAIDAGYRLIIVLAGLHNSLRSQTQLRLDEAVLGFDTTYKRKFDQTNARVGVGLLAGTEFLHAHSFTSSDDRGDFSLSVAKNIGVSVGGKDPVILVVKKNSSILRNLHRWATGIRQEMDPLTGRSVVRGVPLLLIDDEADNASVNTKDVPLDEDGQPLEEYKPSVINGLIRKLLLSFEQSVYLGYTATPFANIFIDEEAETQEHGKDIYPRSFIINLPASSTYVGPARVFGLREDAGLGLQEVRPLPIVRQIDDYEAWLPDGHKKDHIPGELPPSLNKAIRSFVLTCALRMARGQTTAHNSMLVHVTRFTAVQAHVAELVEKEVASLRRRLEYGDGALKPSLTDELRDLWEHDFVTTATEMRSNVDLKDQLGPVPQWDKLARLLAQSAAGIRILTINGTAQDVLEYQHHPEGLSVIAIGGDKLSRGLTLEGLSVSYYLRASRMYDTLMQMGRWFGYRPGYLDACRLYTTAELRRWYAAVTAANEELLREFDYMAAIGATPKDFGLRVRNHPDGLLVTARTKLRNARKVQVTFAGTISETIIFRTDEVSRKVNVEAAEALVTEARQLGYEQQRENPLGSRRWDRVPAESIRRFLLAYCAHEDALKVIPKTLSSYIETRLTAEPAELTAWTVLLVSNTQAQASRRTTLGGISLGLIERSQYPSGEPEYESPERGRYSIRRLISPNDEWADLSDEERARAIAETKRIWRENQGQSRRQAEPHEPSGIATRHVRPPTRGLLMMYPLFTPEEFGSELPTVGVALSFPTSEKAKPIEYTVTNIYWQQEFSSI